jgi:transcriptional regulator GlxA family with amidase domain
MAPFQIGVMMETIQFSDIAGLDILGNLSKDYLNAVADFIPPEFHEFAIDMVIHYISTDLNPASMTPSMRILPTVTYDDCPRDLDILLIGGPLPSHRPAAADKFLKEAAEKTGTILTTCIGSMWLASAGVLDGKRATTNRGALEWARGLYPNVEWVDERWVSDGNIWTSGGAGAGIDMIGEFARSKWDRRFVDHHISSLDFNPDAVGKYYK